MQLIRHRLTAAAFPVLIACAFAAAPTVHAAEAIASGARLAATCTGCHGTNGATTGTALPALAGQSRETLLTSLKAFKAGTRPATVMTQIAKGYSEEQLAMLAAFFAAQRADTTAQGGRP
jgi:cytochrome c553